jgi:hypothetical protein
MQICFEVEMNNTNQDQESSTVGVRFRGDVREALEHVAAHDGCSVSAIVRRFTLEGLRRAGLLDEPIA